MNKKLFFNVLTVIAVVFSVGFFSSCGGDDDDDELAIDTSKSYQVVIHNNIDVAKVNASRSDGNLYDVYVAARDGQFYSVGDIRANEEKSITIKTTNDETNAFFVFLKLGSSKQVALESGIYTPEQSTGKMMIYRLYSGKTSDVYISENVKYSQFKTNDINEVKNLFDSMLLRLGL